MAIKRTLLHMVSVDADAVAGADSLPPETEDYHDSADVERSVAAVSS